jgi:hypothetical protein
MRTSRIRTAAHLIIFGGWMLPAMLARFAPARMGPALGGEVAGLFNGIAGGWIALAGAYAAVLAVRLRRDLGD